MSSRPDRSSIARSDGLPIRGPAGGFQGELFRGRLIDVHAPAWRLINGRIAVLHGGTAFENLQYRLVKRRKLLDAEVGNGQIKMNIGGLADGTQIARPMPGRAHVKELRQGGNLARDCESARLAQ